MTNAVIEYLENSVRIIPDEGYCVRMLNKDDTYSYSDGFVQIPNDAYDESKVDTILIKDIPPVPPEPVPPEPEPDVDSDTALTELEEVIDDDKR